MLTKITRACGVALVFSLVWATQAAACWVCLSTGGGGCPFMCHSDPERSGAVYCTDACSYCILSGSCRPFGPPGFEADGTAIEVSKNAESVFTSALGMRPLVPFGGFDSFVYDSRSLLGIPRRNCQGMVVERFVSRLRAQEIRLEARQILV